MAFNNVEIEIQTRIENTAALIEFLKKSAEKLYETHQRDEYYTPPHKNYLEVRPVNEWLRLRAEDGSVSICYKDWHTEEDGSSTHCDEYETVIGDLENMKKIFAAMDCKTLTVVDKHRTVWRYKDWEVSLDRVENLGEFVEVEYSGKENVEPKEEVSRMIQFLRDCGCGKIERNNTGYPFLLLFPEEARYEEV